MQRSDGRWIVLCEDCKRNLDTASAIGVNVAVDSFEAAEAMWESHCERPIPRMRRGA